MDEEDDDEDELEDLEESSGDSDSEDKGVNQITSAIYYSLKPINFVMKIRGDGKNQLFFFGFFNILDKN